MIRSLSYLLVLALVIPSQQQSTPLSPCPNVFMYEPPGTEPGRWYGVVNLSTDSTLHSLWLNIVLDSKADILGNWVGDVTTTDNIDFKIENTKMKIHPGPATSVRFFVQYSLVQNKAPRLQAIRLNGREICNANNPLPAIDRPDNDDKPRRPGSNSRPNSKPEIITKPETTRPNNWNVDRPRPSDEGPVYVPSENPPIDMTYVHPNSIGDGQVPAQSVGTQTGNKRPPNNGFLTTALPPIRNNQNNRDDPNDYFEGGQPVIIVPSKPSRGSSVSSISSGNRGSGECGKVLRNNPVPLVVNGQPTLEGQWPWQIALYQTQTVDNKYICGGTLVTHKHIITAAHCVTRKGSSRIVNPNTLTVYLGKHNLRTSVEGVQIRLVGEIVVHPQYNASSFSRDLGILTLREPVQYTDFVRPACLWPENLVDLSNVIGRKGSVVGWGFDDKGIATEELTLVEMPVVDQETCIRSYSEFFARFTSDFTFCAGYRNGVIDELTGAKKSTSVCNGDSGGGMVFFIENSWYLRGLVSLSVARQNEYRCDPTHFVVFTDLAKFLPWIKQRLSDY